MANTLWINAKKIMKVAYLIICISVLFFVFSCLLSIPPSYIEAAKEEGGYHFIGAFYAAERPSMVVNFRDYCRSSCDVKIIPGYVLWRY